MKFDLRAIAIKEIGLSEVELLTEYRMAYLTEMQGERPDEYVAMLKKELNDFFLSAMSQGLFFALMAVHNEEILSFGAMALKKIPGDFNHSSYLEGDILNMYTVPDARRQGVSALILQRLIDEAKKRGITKISLHTSKDGEKLYRKFGFSEPAYPVLERVTDL